MTTLFDFIEVNEYESELKNLLVLQYYYYLRSFIIIFPGNTILLVDS